MPGLPAARQGDEIGHSLEFLGMMLGSVLGAIAGAAIIVGEVAAIVATEGAAIVALPMAIGAAGMTFSGGGLAGGQLARGLETLLFGGPPTTGVLQTGSPNVFIGGQAAARTVEDVAQSCHGLYWLYHFSTPAVQIAEGAKYILINNQHAARIKMKLVCGAEVKAGEKQVLLGGPTARVLPVALADAEEAFRKFLGEMFQASFEFTAVAAIFAGPEAVALFWGMYGVCYLVNDALGKLGDKLGPGWRDTLQGGFGVALTALPLFGKGPPGRGMEEGLTGRGIEEAQPEGMREAGIEQEQQTGQEQIVEQQQTEEQQQTTQKELSRPYIRKSVREEVERRAPRTEDGRFIDPNTGEPIDGKPDLGHKPGHEFWREKMKAEEEGLTQKEFNDRMNDPDLYQLEDPSSNRSHRYEEPK